MRCKILNECVVAELILVHTHLDKPRILDKVFDLCMSTYIILYALVEAFYESLFVPSLGEKTLIHPYLYEAVECRMTKVVILGVARKRSKESSV